MAVDWMQIQCAVDRVPIGTMATPSGMASSKHCDIC